MDSREKSTKRTVLDKGGTIRNRICNLHRWNSQRAQTKKSRTPNQTDLQPRLTTLDGWCLPDTPWPWWTAKNTQCNEPCREQIPHPFGAAKCKVVKNGKRKKSALKLNGEILEEVPSYKYLGEIINNKGNLSDQIAEISKKVKGATTRIQAEAGTKNLKA